MNSFLWIAILCAGLAWALSTGWVSTGWADDGMSDAAKRAKVEELYSGYKREFPDVQDIEPTEAMRLVQEGKAIFIDVRDEKEQNVSMLPSAVTEKEFLKDPYRYRGLTLIGYCTISYRSGKLAEMLKPRGITLLNLKGGLLAWVHAGGKLYDRNGETHRIHVYGRQWDLAPKGYEAVW
ncbi:MAG: rhodanese-like domain-containing protein [Hyphomicrobiales bacterium]